jgi:hypothetical protein
LLPIDIAIGAKSQEPEARSKLITLVDVWMDHMAGAAMDGQVPLGPVAVPLGPVVKIYIQAFYLA